MTGTQRIWNRMEPRDQAELEASLELISRAIRDKLDRVGIKLHLNEWQALTLAERAQLRDTACESAAEIKGYAALVDDLVRRRTGKAPDRMTRCSGAAES
jgi:Conserved nitrate reductase-associated protein (Nitr_red_assoc)